MQVRPITSEESSWKSPAKVTTLLTYAVTEALNSDRKTYVNVEFSDADHGFFEGASYQPRAVRQSWALLLEFLRSRAS
jgi:dienelactone hydrolase